MDTRPYTDPLPTPEEMARWDTLSATDFGLLYEMLMENASREALAVLREELGRLRGLLVVLLAGPGNNGGDAIALSRHLQDQGADVRLLLKQSKSEYKDVASYHLALARRAKVPMETVESPDPALLSRADVLVDGLLGTGFSGEMRPDYLQWVDAVNEQTRAHRPPFVLSLDIPSGLNGLSGLPSPRAVRATATVTFEAAKLGLAMAPARESVGRLHVRRIGIPTAVQELHPASARLLMQSMADLLPVPSAAMHKGSAGHVLIVGGSPGLTGAPMLAALGALRGGAGLATIACPEGLASEIKAGQPDIMTLPMGQGVLWDKNLLRFLKPRLADFHAVVLGPGLGRNQYCEEFFRAFMKLKRPQHQALVVDADALYHLARAPEILKLLTPEHVLTPHPGEMARLLDPGTESPDRNSVKQDRVNLAREYADSHSCTLVLKGACTVIAAPGKPAFVSPFAVPNLAVAGSGDVLAGLLGSFLARAMRPLDAACLAVYLHGYCGQLLNETNPLRGNLASEIAHGLPRAMCTLKETRACRQPKTL